MDTRAVLFDFGGTLFSYRRFRRHSLGLIVEAAARLGLEREPRELGLAWRESSEAAFRDFLALPYYLHRDLFHDTFRRFARHFGVPNAEPELDWFHTAQRDLAVEHVELRDDCRDVLRKLREAGLHVGIVSNIDDDYLEPMLERCELAPLLDSWLSSERALSCKPDPGIFRQALALARAEPEQTLFVGDSPENDIAGARPLGLRTVLIREAGTSPPGAEPGAAAAEPHHTIERLSELLPIALGERG